jgi:gluconate 5-dehydrogenase
VVLHGRAARALAEAADRIEAATGVRPDSVRFDVTSAEQVAAGVGSLVARHGVPDILVNNAGLQRRAPIQEFAPADWDAVIASNLSSMFYVSRHVTPGMVERGSGKVINIASVQSKLARQTIAPYSASKGGVAMLTQGMAADLARHNVQVNAISPGYFATEMNRALVEDPDFDAWLTQRTPARRWGDVSELRGALVFLASDASSFVSGHNLVVDGGMTAVV